MVRESAKLMRSVTKDARLFAAATSDPNWTKPLLKDAAHYLDYISIHGYWDPLFHVNNPASYIDCMMKTDAPEQDIRKAIGILQEMGLADRIKIAYDEWNLRNWHHPWHGDLRRGFDMQARRKNDIASTYTMADALFSACFLNACLRHADIVEMACFSPIVNTRGAIRVDKDGLTRRTTFYTLLMYTNYLLPNIVPVQLDCQPLQHNGKQTDVLDVILTTDAEGSRYVCAVVNKDPNNDQPLTLDFASLKKRAPKQLNAWVLCGQSPDDYNDRGDEHVRPEQRKLKVRDGQVSIPAHSITFVTIE